MSLLTFTQVPLSAHASTSFTLDVPERHTVAVLGDEESGVGRLGGYALGLERPPAGSARLFDTVVADLPEPERLAFRRRVGYLPAAERPNARAPGGPRRPCRRGARCPPAAAPVPGRTHPAVPRRTLRLPAPRPYAAPARRA